MVRLHNSTETRRWPRVGRSTATRCSALEGVASVPLFVEVLRALGVRARANWVIWSICNQHLQCDRKIQYCAGTLQGVGAFDPVAELLGKADHKREKTKST